MKAWYSAAELAAAKLPGLPGTFQGINKRARAEGWQSKREAGVTYYHTSILPEAARIELMRRETAAAVPAPVSAPKSVMPVVVQADLRDFQRTPMHARQLILNHIELQVVTLDISRLRAETEFANMAAAGTLPPHLQKAVSDANARKGEGRIVSAATIRRWRKEYETGGAASLAVRGKKDSGDMPAWFEPFWKLRAIPSKPSVAGAYDQLKRRHPEIKLPSLRSVQRFVDGLDAITKNVGQFGPREMKKFRAFKKRDFSMIEPGAIYAADGYKVDLEVLSPDGKKIIRAELISVIDVATRRIVGWAVGLHENAILVGEALLMACRLCVCAIFYVDNGSGFVNDYIKNPDAGLLSALGIEMINALPYNSQAKGVIERFHQTIKNAAKFLPNYIGEEMDDEARNIVFKRDRALLKAEGRTRYAMPWEDFLKWVSAEIEHYNNKPHSAFAKIRDPETMTLRHPSPNEVWQSFVERGWEPVLPDQHAIDDARRPYNEVVVQRGRVRVNNGWYGHERLAAEGWHGQTVRAGMDLHDSTRVWVRALDGRLICVAGLDWNKVEFIPLTRVERADVKRKTTQLRNAERVVEEKRIALEGAPTHRGLTVIENLTPDQEARADELLAAMERPALPAPTLVEPAALGERPIFNDTGDWVRWVIAGNGTDEDRARLAEKMQRRSFCMLHDLPFPGDAGDEEAEMRAAV